MKFRLREKFTSEIFFRQKYPDLRYTFVFGGTWDYHFDVSNPQDTPLSSNEADAGRLCCERKDYTLTEDF